MPADPPRPRRRLAALLVAALLSIGGADPARASPPGDARVAERAAPPDRGTEDDATPPATGDDRAAVIEDTQAGLDEPPPPKIPDDGEDAPAGDDDGDGEDGGASTELGDGEDGGPAASVPPEDVTHAVLGPLPDCTNPDPDDPLAPIYNAIRLLRAAGYRVDGCVLSETSFRQRQLFAVLSGNEDALLQYVLQEVANDGFAMLLQPTDRGEYAFVARPTRTVERGVAIVGLTASDLSGRFLAEDDAGRLARLLGNLSADTIWPADLLGRLAVLGYRGTLSPAGEGRLSIALEPGRLLRRVRVHGALPLPERDVLRALSLEARPGAVARGRCVSPKQARAKTGAPPICGDGDLACREWERRESERVERALFDAGYWKGRVRLALTCGRAPDEADLHVYLDKGDRYRVARGHPVVEGVSDADSRWLARQYQPRSFLLFRKRITRDFMERAKIRSERVYAEPGFDARVMREGGARQSHPEVRVRSSYEDIDFARRADIPDGGRHPLKIDVRLGTAVETAYVADTSDARGRRRDGLDFSKRELDANLQIFKRREPATDTTASREAEALRAFYQSKGYLFAQITGTYDDFGSMHRLSFRIAEGPRARIKSLRVAPISGPPPSVVRNIAAKYRQERKLRGGGGFSESDALADIALLTAAYNEAGFLCASVTIDVAFWREGLDTRGAVASFDASRLLAAQGKPFWLEQLDPAGVSALLAERQVPLYVRVRVDPGPRVITSKKEQVRYLTAPIDSSRAVIGEFSQDEGEWGLQRILRGTALRLDRDPDEPGNVPISLDLGRRARTDIVQRYRENGFPIADAEVTWEVRRPTPGSDDTIVELADIREITDPRVGTCRERTDEPVVLVDPVIHVYEGRKGVFGTTRFRGNFKTRTRILARERRWREGADYDGTRVDKTVAGLEDLGVARAVLVTPYPVACELTPAGAQTPGAEGSTASEASGDDSRCVVHHVVSIEEGQDVAAHLQYGLGLATLNPFYVFLRPKFPNIFGTAVDVSLDGLFGFDLSRSLGDAPLCAGQACYERAARGTITRRHLFGSRTSLELSGGYQLRVTPARGRIDSAYGGLRLTRSWGKEWSVYGGYLIQVANLAKDILQPLGGSSGAWLNRTEGVVQARSGLLEGGLVWAHVDNPFNPNDGFIATVEMRMASPWLGGEDWWYRADATWQHFIPLRHIAQERLGIRYSLIYGQIVPFTGPMAPTAWVPEVWRYYGGGTADLGLRGILPETMLVDVEEIELPYGGVLYRARAQGGTMRALGTLAFQVISVKDFFGGRLAHSVFYDFGVIARDWSKVHFPRDLRHSVGVNLIKWDINIVTLAVGYAILVPTRYNIGPTDDRNGRFVFDVGVTF